MKREDQFFVVVLITVLIVRIGLWIAGSLAADPNSLGLTIFGLRLHHWMYGLVLLLIGIIIENLIVLGVGAGLFLDEFTYILIGGSTHTDNYSWISLLGTIICILIVFYLRKRIIEIIVKIGRVQRPTQNSKS